MRHDLGAAAKGAHRQSAAEHLTERRKVGADAVQLLGTPQPHAKTGHHLVKNQ